MQAFQQALKVSEGSKSDPDGAIVIFHCSTMYWSMQMCSAIPRGKVSTYGAMAAALQSSARAAGQVRRCALPDSQIRR